MAKNTNDNGKYDVFTVAAISVADMCLVTFDHEALGHGGVCLLLGGHIRLLTSSLFQCDLRSVWIDPAGPFGNLLVGSVALLLVRAIAQQRPRPRLFFVLVACFSFYWESGYVIKAMYQRQGDLYFAGENFLGEPSLWWRIAAAAAGVGLYGFTTRWAVRSLPGRQVARVAWMSATLGAALAALTYSGTGFADLRDAVLEIGGASFPLLFLRQEHTAQIGAPGAGLTRDRVTIAVSMLLYALFIATLGRGLHFQ